MDDEQPTVYIVDDDPSVLLALERLLADFGFEVRAYKTAEGFLQDHSARRSGCVVVDLMMPGIDGLQLQEKLATCGRPIIFLSGQGDLSSGISAMKAGAVDFLTKPCLQEDLLAAISKAIARDRQTRAQRDENNLLSQRLALLTPRERQVFELVAAGRLNKQVAAELGTAEKTVKVHRARVMNKLGARSVVDLARIADRLRVAGEPAPLDLRRTEAQPY